MTTTAATTTTSTTTMNDNERANELEQQQKQQREQMLQTITQIKVYGDSRDQIIGNFNKLQALWGTGTAYYSHTNPPLDLTESQPVGFHSLNERYKLQQAETQQQRSRLKQLYEQLSELQKHVAAMKSKLEECRRKKVVLGNRVLKVMIMQEIENRKGFPIQADEEKLRYRMENILSELHCQTKYRGCLNELMSQLKQIQSQQHRTQQVHLDDSIVEDIKEHLKNEQIGIQHLIQIIKQDRKTLEEANTNSANTSLTQKTTNGLPSKPNNQP